MHLIQFDEPFGLSVVEAMATGTPVIAFRRGSMPELIDDGVTGFLVEPDDIDAAVAAVERIAELDRAHARAHVERQFSAERMVDDYLALYARLAPHAAAFKERQARPPGARCDACHTRHAVVVRSRDGLVTICRQCARGVDLASIDASDAIAAIVSRALPGQCKALSHRLQARQTLHETRRERRRE